jgi:hypothetical protein
MYPASALLEWGPGSFGSEYTTKIQTPDSLSRTGGIGATVDATAYVCKLYPDAGIEIAC